MKKEFTASKCELLYSGEAKRQEGLVPSRKETRSTLISTLSSKLLKKCESRNKKNTLHEQTLRTRFLSGFGCKPAAIVLLADFMIRSISSVLTRACSKCLKIFKQSHFQEDHLLPRFEDAPEHIFANRFEMTAAAVSSIL